MIISFPALLIRWNSNSPSEADNKNTGYSLNKSKELTLKTIEHQEQQLRQEQNQENLLQQQGQTQCAALAQPTGEATHKIKRVPIGQIIACEEVRCRAAMSYSWGAPGPEKEQAVERLANVYREGEPCRMPPPLKVVFDRGSGLYEVVDGHMRLEAAKTAFVSDVDAHVLSSVSLDGPDQDTIKADLRYRAGFFNAANSVPLTPHELETMFLAYLDSGRFLDESRKPKPSRIIARELKNVYSFRVILEKMKQLRPMIYRRHYERGPMTTEPKASSRGNRMTSQEALEAAVLDNTPKIAATLARLGQEYSSEILEEALNKHFAGILVVLKRQGFEISSLISSYDLKGWTPGKGIKPEY